MICIKNIIAILFLLCQIVSKAQNTVIRYTIKDGTLINDTLNPPLSKALPSLNNDDLILSKVISVEKKNNYCITTVKYPTIFNETIVFIGDGWSHEIYIHPNDTLDIFLEKYSKENRVLKNGTTAPWIFNLKYTGKYGADAAFYDSLAQLTGLMHRDYQYYNPNKMSIDSFVSIILHQYKKRKDYLNEFNSNNHVSDNFYSVALAEITCAFFSKIFSINLVLNKTPVKLQKEKFIKIELDEFINRHGFENEFLYKNTAFYSGFLRDYVRDSVQEDGWDFSTDSLLYRIFDSYKKLKKTFIKEYELCYLLENMKAKDTSTITTLIDSFRLICTNKEYVSFIDSVYKIKKNKQEAITLEQMFNSKLINTKGKKISISSLLHHRPVVIDCWASWCAPCLKMIPYSRELEKNYADKVDFVYISLDHDYKKWKTKEEELGLEKKSFLLMNNFKSPFAEFFKINSIPRYIIFDKKGKLVNDNAPQPLNKQELVSILNELISS